VRRRSRIRVRAFQRFLRSGTTVEIFVTKRDRIGKYTKFRIRGRRPPSRIDRCMVPGRSRPQRCPRGVS
jgi:hypothetical protein